MPKPGIIGFIGAIPVIMPRLGSKSAGKNKVQVRKVFRKTSFFISAPTVKDYAMQMSIRC